MINAQEVLPNQLILTNYKAPILRSKTQPVHFPLDCETKQNIADMLYSFQPAQLIEGGVGMAANQWGIDKSIFLYSPNGNDKTDEVEVIINPSYVPIATQETDVVTENVGWEGCFSIPFAIGKIKRNTTIHVKYQNLKGEFIEKTLSGWPARVWQHENDHLNGILYDDTKACKCLDKMQFSSKEELDAYISAMREERAKKLASPAP